MKWGTSVKFRKYIPNNFTYLVVLLPCVGLGSYSHQSGWMCPMLAAYLGLIGLGTNYILLNPYQGDSQINELLPLLGLVG